MTVADFVSSGPGLPLIGPVEPNDIHVMSFNVRNARTRSHIHTWERRRELVEHILHLEMLTIVGMQEVVYSQMESLRRALPTSYAVIGVGRDDGLEAGEFNPIAFNRNRFELLDVEHFWLSDTPSRPGSASWGNTNVRMATTVLLCDVATGKQFVVLNTHLDHRSTNSRQRSADLLSEKIASVPVGRYVICTGDFNSAAGRSATFQRLAGRTGLLDSWVAADLRITPSYSTRHGYSAPTVDGDRIDWILVQSSFKVVVAGINTYRKERQWASDHWPMQAVLRVRA